MRPFQYTRATTVQQAMQAARELPQAVYLAGGTNLLDLMKEDVARPEQLVDITRLPLTLVSALTTGPRAGGVSLGALAKNAATANDPLIRQRYPLVSQAMLAGASAQIRNMATNGGNPNQRTRCSYFYDTAMPCNKRTPQSGCSAREGVNRMHAIFGWSDDCVAVHPSDMCVALLALDAVVKLRGGDGQERYMPLADYHRLPGDTPHLDNNLQAGELITAIELPRNNYSAHSYYLKIRDRSSYAFALVSVAAALELQEGRIVKASVVLGSVAHKPWRATEAENLLKGQVASDANFAVAATAALQGAKPLAHNAFKIELGKRAVERALQLAFRGTAL